MPRRNLIMSEHRRSSRSSAVKRKRRHGVKSIIPHDHPTVPPLQAFRSRPPLAQRHIGMRMRYSTIRHTTSRINSATLSQRQSIPPLLYRKLDPLEIPIEHKKYWMASLLIPKILTYGQPSSSRRHSTHLLCWVVKPSTPIFQFMFPRFLATCRREEIILIQWWALRTLQGGEF